MAFFDKVKDLASGAANAINDAAKDVQTGAKEFSDKSKLKRSIKTEEQKIDNLYKAIGEKLFSENAVAPAGFEQEFADINASMSEIGRIQSELNSIEAASKCPGCGAKITSGQKFCQGCGKNLE